MTLFVVVERNLHNGKEYINVDSSPEGYTEYADAERRRAQLSDEVSEGWYFYVGRVVDAKEPVGEPRGLSDLS